MKPTEKQLRKFERRLDSLASLAHKWELKDDKGVLIAARIVLLADDVFRMAESTRSKAKFRTEIHLGWSCRFRWLPEVRRFFDDGDTNGLETDASIFFWFNFYVAVY